METEVLHSEEAEQKRSRGERFLSLFPGTLANARKRVHQLFDARVFDPSTLTVYEEGVLKDSIEQKYSPALAKGTRARLFGVIIGALAPFEFLLIGAVTLAASASSTTGAWYSITLKEMKEKFVKMGLNLTSNLLTSDLLANSLSMYAGIGLAYRLITWPMVMEFYQNPDPVSALKMITSLALSGVIHVELSEILDKKEQSCIQFDFNDATLAGMTEEQQKFFAQSVSEVNGFLKKIETSSGVPLNRNLFGCASAIITLVKKFDIRKQHADTFKAIESALDVEDMNFSPDITAFAALLSAILNQLLTTLDLESPQMERLLNKFKVLEKAGESKTPEQVAAIVSDVVPAIMKFLEKKGEKGIRKTQSPE